MGKNLFAVAVYGLWCLGQIAEPAASNISTAIQIAATVLIGVIGYLIKSSIDDMKRDIGDQGDRLRDVELDLRELASKQGIRLSKHHKDEA